MALDYDILKKNIKYLMQNTGISSVTELSKRVKMQQSTLQRMLVGEVKDPKYVTLKQIAEFFKISPVDLIECDLQENPPRTLVEVDGDPYDYLIFKEVPVLGNTQVGHGSYWPNMKHPVENRGGYIRWPSYDENAYALKSVDDSMIPRIKEGEFIIVEPNHIYHPGDEVLVVTEEGQVMVKTFLFERDALYHLLPVNENVAPIKIPKKKVTIIQYIAGIAKSSLWHT
ncbi:S24 family peptidase [Arsenophonus nasoniae]|uniref:LexA repressor n=1 Tax=Arsenophonus nasoniae TaxID=638 RepID=A0A4V1BWX7_9GAMM|nr:S24 family peptidase [Arsenophonus nasoniae]QBY43733.1 LexA repressor [Arsenophonus nasoniae]WGM00238.1 S24 family peptidase [Arsenophonus nasoniae]WGM00530.1 S24 family peptidase [Arsenophonus nasoniae]WGM12519.1 S24 family peptidase [Arsenophonus nasoniae]WGM17194.1 S24 family peptidase [Arsenophonus nasoniae]